jgi:hypothetical protein
VLPDLNKTTRRAALALAIAASIALPTRPAHAQSDEEKAAARALATQGADELKQGHFAQALDLVSRAQAIFNAPTHLLMIAKAQIGLGKLVAAQETLLKLTRQDLPPNAPQAFRNAQAAGREDLAAIEPRIASLRIDLDGLGQRTVTVKLDDEVVPPALLGVYRPVDPGPHVIMVYPAGQAPVRGTIELHDAEKNQIRLAIPNAPAVPVGAGGNPGAGQQVAPTATSGSGGFFTPLRAAGIGVGAVGVIGLVVGGVFVAKGGSTQSQADAEAIKDGCSPSDTSQCSGAKTAAQKADLNGPVKSLDDSPRASSSWSSASRSRRPTPGRRTRASPRGSPERRVASRAPSEPSTSYHSSTCVGRRAGEEGRAQAICGCSMTPGVLSPPRMLLTST